jgi:hypothetical protein
MVYKRKEFEMPQEGGYRPRVTSPLMFLSGLRANTSVPSGGGSEDLA